MRSLVERTLQEIGKSLCDVWQYLQITSKGEAEYNDKLLPTLGFATRIEGNGYIRYKLFKKPITILLTFGTTLSMDCVFCSLRQELLENHWRAVYTKFHKSFSMFIGCPRGPNCIICSNTGTI